MSNEFKELLKEKVANGELNPEHFDLLPSFPINLPDGVNPLAISCWIGSC